MYDSLEGEILVFYRKTTYRESVGEAGQGMRGGFL